MEETDTKMYPKWINKNLKKTEKASTYKIKQLYKKWIFFTMYDIKDQNRNFDVW